MRTGFIVCSSMAAIAFAAVSGCSGTGTHAISDSAAALLQGDVAALTTAAADKQPAAEQAALTKLSSDLAHARSNGEVTAERAAAVQAAIAAVTRDLVTAPPTSTPAPPPATTMSPRPPSPTPRPAPSDPKKGKGHGGGDGGDGG